MLLAAALNAFGPDLRGQGWSSFRDGVSGEIGCRLRHSPGLNPGSRRIAMGLCGGRATCEFIFRGGVATEVPG